jgi:Protein of unknown function (DUF4235)
MIKLFYKPFGLLASVLGGILAGVVFKQFWKLVSHAEDAPDATDRDTSWAEVLASSAIQGAVFGGVKALVDRAGAKSFEHATGAWPGNTEPRQKD